MTQRWRRKGGMTRLGDILRSAADAGRLPTTPGLSAAWLEAAGELLASHVEVRSLEGGTLYLGADQLQWMNQVERLSAQLRGRLKDQGFAVDTLQCELLGRA